MAVLLVDTPILWFTMVLEAMGVMVVADTMEELQLIMWYAILNTNNSIPDLCRYKIKLCHNKETFFIRIQDVGGHGRYVGGGNYRKLKTVFPVSEIFPGKADSHIVGLLIYRVIHIIRAATDGSGLAALHVLPAASRGVKLPLLADTCSVFQSL